MKFVIGYAGIPSVIYDQVIKRKDHICTHDPNCEFVSRPLQQKSDGQFRYSEKDTNYFLREFAERLKNDDHNILGDTGFALIYVQYEAITKTYLVDSFFPSILTIPVDFNLDCSSTRLINQSKNNLIEMLRHATNNIKNSIPIVKKEVTEHDSKTPLLLPIKNFCSNHLVAELRKLQDTLPSATDKMSALKDSIRNFERHHPRTPLDKHPKPCYVDFRKIEFHPPGSARHAFARSKNTHPETCLLSGRRRLGAPYDRSFHYDCISGNGRLRGEFWGCHGEQSIHVGNPHLNVAPNDFVR